MSANGHRYKIALKLNDRRNKLKIQENDSLKNENANNAIHIFDVIQRI